MSSVGQIYLIKKYIEEHAPKSNYSYKGGGSMMLHACLIDFMKKN